MEKKDWLAFLGPYLSFAGSMIVSLFATFHSLFLEEREIKREEFKWNKKIQPLLAIRIVAMDSHIYGTADVINLNKPKSSPKHKNVTIEIENAGEYPIRNVIVFQKYLWNILKKGEKKQIQVAYSDSPDVLHWKNHIIELYESEFKRTDSWIPKEIQVSYEDVDGNDRHQNFELCEFDGTFYYSLESILDEDGCKARRDVTGMALSIK